MTASELIAELQQYRKELQRILDGFERGSETLTIATDDDPIYRQMVVEIHDLLNDEFGIPNQYSHAVKNHFNQGIQNYLSTPSHNSVQSIINELGAAITRLNRNPGFLQNRKDDRKANRTNPASKRVFIGHGHSNDWKDIREFLKDRCGLEFEEFNRQPAAGKSTKERLEEMLDASGFALIIMTAEDEAKDGTLRARENVVHEAGLFQGRLGFERAIILREEGCEEFSNIEGLVQIPFPKGNVMAVTEKIREVLEREGLIHKSGS
jgi:predicted nucleotide-binding protein